MTELDFSRCPISPFKHQREDAEWLVRQPYAFIASEMRTGKTKIVIDAVQFLHEAGLVNTMIVVTPAPVRDVWFDPDLGELAKHLWPDLSATIVEFHARLRLWEHGPKADHYLKIYITNFEYLRQKQHVAELLSTCGPKTLLALDESSFIKNHKAQQTEGCMKLRQRCGRVVLLNGTPLFHSPLDLFSQGNMLHPSIIGTRYITHFKARYCIQVPVLGKNGQPLDNGYGKPVQTITGWRDLDDLQRRFAPFTVRRLQAECLDLPPKLDPVTLTAALTPETWRVYKAMRDEMVVWLREQAVAVSATAAVKVMRLSQITSGFLGGVEAARTVPLEGLVLPIDWNKDTVALPFPEHQETAPVTEVGREKLEVLLWFIGERLEADPNLHLVAWGRFRAEVLRMEAEVKAAFPQFQTAVIMGGQKKDERLHALSLLKPETSPTGPVFVAGIEGTGSFGLDMCAAHTCVTMSSGYSAGRSAQTLDRVYGPNQKYPIAYFDVIAVGPRGQKTIDRDILIARRTGQEIATWTAAHWVKVLTEE